MHALILILSSISLYWATKRIERRTHYLNALQERLNAASEDLDADRQAAKDQIAERDALAENYDDPWHPDNVWCDGVPIPAGTELGYELFAGVERRAMLHQVYNSIPFEQGGWEQLAIDFYRVQGLTEDHAQRLVAERIELGLLPSLFYLDRPQDDEPLKRIAAKRRAEAQAASQQTSITTDKDQRPWPPYIKPQNNTQAQDQNP